jgi:hypothetical protein
LPAVDRRPGRTHILPALDIFAADGPQRYCALSNRRKQKRARVGLIHIAMHERAIADGLLRQLS